MSKLRMLLFILMSIVLLAYGNNSDDAPKAVAKEFVEAVADGDIDKVKEMALRFNESKKENPAGSVLSTIEGNFYESLSDMVDRFKSRVEEEGGIKITVGDFEYYSDDMIYGNISLTVTFQKSGKRDIIQFGLMREDDAWKIGHLDLSLFKGSND